jgi:flavin reductase (DIM6/NTAB) family NADH-FMN oxidoreductase RutF
MQTDDAYELLRQLASPVVAITTRWRGRSNGMISDSVVRASISPKLPRLSLYIHKWHLTHELVWKSGRFALHLLHEGELDLVYRLGFVSGREADKMREVPHRLGSLGVPVLADCYAAFECRVINTMDTGYSTHYLADVVATHRGRGDRLLTPGYLRANMPRAWSDEFARNYRTAQEHIERNPAIQPITWPGPEPE